MRAGLVILLAASCGKPPAGVEVPAEPEPPRIVCTERGPNGGRLVILGEDAVRVDELTTGTPGADPVRDTGAAFSPDGAWVVFASSRGRQRVHESSLWIVAAAADATPRRLTMTESTDMDPVFSPDGKFILYSSIERTGTSLDLWRVGVDLDAAGGPALRGAPERLTSDPGNEMQPSPAPDGSAIAFTLATDDGSAIWIKDVGGAAAPRRLTAGPGDISPSWSPDGKTIAFASGRKREVGDELRKHLGQNIVLVDTDLYLIDADGGEPRLVIDEPYADQVGPRWSRDGRYLFATAVVRSLEKDPDVMPQPLLASVVYIDLREKPVTLRALHDPGGEAQRSSPALGRAVLDATALHRNPSYSETACQALKAQLKETLEEEACRVRRKTEPDFDCSRLEPDPRWSELCR